MLVLRCPVLPLACLQCTSSLHSLCAVHIRLCTMLPIKCAVPSGSGLLQHHMQHATICILCVCSKRQTCNCMVRNRLTLAAYLTWLITLHLPSAFLSRKVMSPGRLPKPHSAKKRPCTSTQSRVGGQNLPVLHAHSYAIPKLADCYTSAGMRMECYPQRPMPPDRAGHSPQAGV